MDWLCLMIHLFLGATSRKITQDLSHFSRYPVELVEFLQNFQKFSLLHIYSTDIWTDQDSIYYLYAALAKTLPLHFLQGIKRRSAAVFVSARTLASPLMPNTFCSADVKILFSVLKIFPMRIKCVAICRDDIPLTTTACLPFLSLSRPIFYSHFCQISF